ncbi:Ig-like domain-containing protein, partial [Planctomycetota bacterium]
YNDGFETEDRNSPDYDPIQLGQGVIAHGRFVMHGQEKTSYATINGALAGDTSLSLDTLPSDWEVGDILVIAGVQLDGDEIRTITAIDEDGARVHFDDALIKDHTPPPHHKAGLELKVHIANTTRNAIIETADGNREATGTFEKIYAGNKPTSGNQYDGRGHVMFMHNDDVDIRYGQFDHLGRTNKRIAVDDTKLDASGTATHIGENPRARYPIHFHRSGAFSDTPAVVHGSSVFNGPGWGYVNHGGYVVMSNNVAYDVDGASFVTERSDERGAFIGNLSIRNDGLGDRGEGGSTSKGRPRELEDKGITGNGIWTQGPLIFLRDNIVSGANGIAYANQHSALDGLQEKFGEKKVMHLQYSKFPERYHPDYLDEARSQASSLPFNEHTGNMAYASTAGLRLDGYHPGRSFHHYGEIVDFTGYNLGFGIQKAYASMIRLTNPTLINDPTTPGEFGTENIAMIDNPHIEGFLVGISTAVTTTMGDISTSSGIFGKHSGRAVEGGYLNNLINIVVNGFHGSASDQTSIRNVTYGQMSDDEIAIASDAFDKYGNHSIARNKFNDSIMERGATSLEDMHLDRQYSILYLNSYAKGPFSYDKEKPGQALVPRRYTVEVDGFVYELMAKREQHADYVPVPSWRFPAEEGYVGPGFDLIRDKTNAELYAMSVADREAMILAVHGEISNNPDHRNYLNNDTIAFPDWQYVSGGYVLPADWETKPGYLDGDDYGMGNVVLKKMTDETGAGIAVDWTTANAGPVTQPDFVEFVAHPWDAQKSPRPIMTLIGNDYDSDWRILNPHDQTIAVQERWGDLNRTPRNNMLFVVNMEQPQHGRIDFGTQHYDYYAPEGFTGIDTFRYHVADLTGKDAWETAYIFVGMDVDESLVNYVPEAEDDQFQVVRGEATLLDVLANDTDPEGRPLTISQIGHPDHDTDVGNPHFGRVEVVDGKILYTPNEYFTGTDRFVYYATDDAGNQTRRGTVSVQVNKSGKGEVNTAPIATNDSATTDEDNA